MTVKFAISVELVIKKGRNLMPCKIGITTNQEARRVYWQNRSTGFANWQTLNIFRSKAAAKEYETAYALRHGCEMALGDSNAPVAAREPTPEYEWWYIYHFDYETEIAQSPAE